jgi:AbrB family looped-hinge helix DNA binding protein
MRITSKGQVTIPKHIRQKLGVQPGDEIGFREEGQALIVEKIEVQPPLNAGVELIKALRGKGPSMRQGRPLVTAEELTELTRGRPMNVDDTPRR